jgi:PIN domain nuclease of toxin-antitoxin system
MFALLVSLALSFWEISISVNALKLHLKDLEANEIS